MASTTPYKGWIQLQPLDEEGILPLVPLLFPLDTPGRYVIGSRNSETVNLLVPEVEPVQEEFPIEAVLVVTNKGEVFLERPAGPNMDVTINGQRLEAGSKSLVPLAIGATVAVGPWYYLYGRAKDLFDSQVLEKVSNIRRCHVCNSAGETVNILSCGHNICPSCRQEGMAQAPPPRLANRNRQGLQDRRFLVAFQQQGHDVPQMPMHCASCRTRVTVGVATASIVSVSANQTAKLVSDVGGIDGRRPLCDGCQNKRGLINARDYDWCETCREMLCSACIVQWHWGHTLNSRVERLRKLDEVDQKLGVITRTVAAVDKEMKEICSSPEVMNIENLGRREGDAMIESLRSLALIAHQCRQQLNSIKERKRALAHGWDETSEEMVAAFDRFVEQFREQKQYMDRLRNGEVSWSLDTISTDDTELELTTPPKSASPSPSSASQ